MHTLVCYFKLDVAFRLLALEHVHKLFDLSFLCRIDVLWLIAKLRNHSLGDSGVREVVIASFVFLILRNFLDILLIVIATRLSEQLEPLPVLLSFKLF